MKYFDFIVLLAIFGSTLAKPTGDLTDKWNSHYNYYWRQYLGRIPPDAIPGGHDVNGKITYIGQVYYYGVHAPGVIVPVEIHEGNVTVYVPIFGIHYKTNADVKILCGRSPEYFQWYETDSKHIFDQMKRKHIIEGGTESSGVTLIGRLNYAKETKIGKVDYFKGYGQANLYFAKGDTETTSAVYQVLVYEDDNLH